LTQPFDRPVEVMLIENLIQSCRTDARRSAADLESPPTSTSASYAVVVCPSPSATV
jgi:hypothetical protein